MSGRIETDESLNVALHGLAHGQDKKILFNGDYVQESDGRLYQGLIEAAEAGTIEPTLKRYPETLKRLKSVEEGCKVRLKAEYWVKFEGCVEFLQGKIGQMYVTVMLGRRGEGDVRRWLEELKSLYIK